MSCIKGDLNLLKPVDVLNTVVHLGIDATMIDSPSAEDLPNTTGAYSITLGTESMRTTFLIDHLKILSKSSPGKNSPVIPYCYIHNLTRSIKQVLADLALSTMLYCLTRFIQSNTGCLAQGVMKETSLAKLLFILLCCDPTVYSFL